MPSPGANDSFDLLGLGAAEAPAPAPQPPVVPAGPAKEDARDPVVPGYPPAWKQSAEVISYPPAVGLEPATGSLLPGLDEAPPTQRAPAAAAEDPLFGAAQPADPSHRRFIVRCEGRWRVRSAPSLSSKVIGTVANGTVVIAQEEPSESAASRDVAPAGWKTAGAIGSLWVQVVRFESQEPMGVSEIKRDAASGGHLYCLRRNALGYGLYEHGLEAIDGPLITLPEHLSVELRTDAQRAAADKSEDVSLTWKLLSAAEQVGRLFSSMSGADEGGINEDMKPQVRRRPEEVFEARQRDQLKKTAGVLKKATAKVLAKAGAAPEGLLAGLSKEVNRRFARLRSSLADTARGPAAAAANRAETGLPGPPGGEVAELEHFVELLTRLERTGGWPELGGDLRQEVINFSNKHSADLEDHARGLGKPAGVLERLASSDSVTNSPALRPSTPAQKPAAAGGGALPLLPPPPPPASGVSTGRLI